jgi:uncharacterized membrane protein
LILILAAGGFFRFIRIGDASLWKDELWSIELATGRGSLHDNLVANVIHSDQPDLTGLGHAAPWWSVFTHLSGVPHQPLYLVILRWWMDALGSSAIAVRSLSAVFSLAAVFVLFDLARFLHGPRIALLAAAICALAVGQLEFAQDARCYSMMIFFGLCGADFLVRVEYLGPTSGRLAALVVCLLATALLHYLCVGAILALAIYAAIRLRGRARIQTAAAFAIGVALILIVWIPLFAIQRKTLPSMEPRYLLEARIQEHARLTLYRIIGLPADFLFGESRAAGLPTKLVLSIFLVTLMLPLIRLFHRRDLLLWVLWGLGTIGFVAAMDMARQTTLVGYPRYTVLASPAVYAVIAAFDWPRRAFIRNAVAISAIGLLAIVAIQRSIDGAPAKEDWRTLAHHLDAVAGPDDLLVFFNDDPYISPGIWYMGFKYYVPDSHRPWLVLDAPANAEVMRQLASRQLIWLIGRFPERQGPRLLPGWIPAYSEEKTTAGAFCPMVRASLAYPAAGRP